jgi:hypothetical protein
VFAQPLKGARKTATPVLSDAQLLLSSRKYPRPIPSAAPKPAEWTQSMIMLARVALQVDRDEAAQHRLQSFETQQCQMQGRRTARKAAKSLHSARLSFRKDMEGNGGARVLQLRRKTVLNNVAFQKVIVV